MALETPHGGLLCVDDGTHGGWKSSPTFNWRLQLDARTFAGLLLGLLHPPHEVRHPRLGKKTTARTRSAVWAGRLDPERERNDDLIRLWACPAP